MSDPRISTFAEFWPYYLGEHRNATCRRLHFVGTAGFFASFGLSIAASPMWFGAAALGVLVLGFIGFRMERTRPAALPLLAMIAAVAAAPPHFYVLLGVLGAYAMAWIGHFKIEGNRPATFSYPLWSLLGDFKMWSVMATGRLWAGDSVDWMRANGHTIGARPAAPH